MATATMSKAEQRSAERAHYIETCEILEINEDETGPYALVPSEDNTATYKVHFAEPRDKANFATGCECSDHYYRHRECKHMVIVSAYCQRIHESLRRPAPVAVAPAKKVRRSAPRLDLVAALQVKTKVTIAQVRRALCPVNGSDLALTCHQNDSKMTQSCPTVAPATMAA